MFWKVAFLDATNAIYLVELARARIFERKLSTLPLPEPPPPQRVDIPAHLHRPFAGGILKYLGKNAKYYPRRKIKF